MQPELLGPLIAGVDKGIAQQANPQPQRRKASLKCLGDEITEQPGAIGRQSWPGPPLPSLFLSTHAFPHSPSRRKPELSPSNTGNRAVFVPT